MRNKSVILACAVSVLGWASGALAQPTAPAPTVNPGSPPPSSNAPRTGDQLKGQQRANERRNEAAMEHRMQERREHRAEDRHERRERHSEPRREHEPRRK